MCSSAVLKTLSLQRDINAWLYATQEQFVSSYLASTPAETLNDFLVLDMCWLPFSKEPLQISPMCCTSAQAVLSRNLWLQHASVAHEYYRTCPLGREDDLDLSCFDGGPILDDVSYNSAKATMCDIPECFEEIKLQVVAAIGLADIFPDGFCENPCRCSASVEKNGCELDDAVYGRSICSPAQPEECGAAFAIQGMASAAVHCGLGKDSCQHFLSTSVCSPFVPLGTSVFVPAGETIESLEEPLRPVLLEAALVSSACFKAQGEFLCNTRLKRCDGGNAIPQRLCRSDCEDNAHARIHMCSVELMNSNMESDKSTDVCHSILNPFQLENITFVQFTELRTTDYLNNIMLGEPMFPAENCHSIQQEGYFSVESTKDVVKCPAPFVHNPTADLAGAMSNSGLGSQLCIQPCPSFIFTTDENFQMWLSYVVPGCIALGLNVLATLCIFTNAREWNNQIDLNSQFLVVSSCFHGLVGALPAVLLGEELPCGCETENCFDQTWMCLWGRLSVAVIHVIMMGITVKMYRCYCGIVNNVTINRSLKYEMYCVVIALAIFCVSIAVEDKSYDSDLYALHFSRSSFLCRIRFPSFLSEFLLVYLPVIAASMVTVVLLVAVNHHIVVNMLRGLDIKKKSKAVMNTSFLCLSSLVVLLMWVINSLSSAPLYLEFDRNYQDWFNRCYKFEFSREEAYAEFQDEMSTMFMDKCGAQPNEKPSVAFQMVGYMGEAFVPVLVALFFARKIMSLSIEKRRATSTFSLPFQSKAKVVNSVSLQAGSLAPLQPSEDRKTNKITQVTPQTSDKPTQMLPGPSALELEN